ncbi:MAG: sigma-70 family RNA polymerase sigma factor [Candidatus Omnitrophica bacterium]|nr:sigma-70 family RNA polymerase sigma factor [Candidatus Omnitrophota bacterium]
MDFETLVKKVSPKLKAIAHKLNYHFTFFDDDDLYQEAVIALWKGHARGELRDKTESYIVQGCFFFLKNHIRTAHKKVDQLSVSLSAMSRDGGDECADAMLPCDRAQETFEFTIVDIMVDDILQCLNEREKEVFMLSLDGLTTRQIGCRLGVSHPMVVKIRKRVRAKCGILKQDISAERLPGA